jgi:hypothetical protein
VSEVGRALPGSGRQALLQVAHLASRIDWARRAKAGISFVPEAANPSAIDNGAIIIQPAKPA